MDKFLKDHKKGEKITHTRIKSDEHRVSGGAFTVDDAAMPQFWVTYYNSVFEKGDLSFLTEVQEDQGPLVVDLDLRQTADVRIYTKEHIVVFMEAVLEKVVALCGPIEAKFPVFIYEKDAVNATDSSNIKDGIHLYFGLSLDKWTKQMLWSRLIAEMPLILEDLREAGLTNGWEGVLDKNVMVGSTNWPVYMSRKPGYQPYKLRYMYDVTYTADTKSMTAVSVSSLCMLEMLPLMSVRCTKYSALKILPEHAEEYDRMRTGQKKKSSMQRTECAQAPTDTTKITTAEQLESAVRELHGSLQPSDYKIVDMHNYTMCLPEKYYGDYSNWLKVGFALKNTEERLFLTWVMFSSKWERFSFGDMAGLKAKWESWVPKTDKTLTWRSIVYWGEMDAPVEFAQAKRGAVDSHINSLIFSKTPVTEFDFAKLLWHLYSNTFVCASIGNNQWYEYTDQRWQEIDSGVTLRVKISDLKGGLSGIIDEKITECEKVNDEVNIKKATRLRSFLTDLKRTDKTRNIMSECRYIFYQRDFVDTLDTKNYILCCLNGVVDFSTGVFRKGVPEDATSKCTRTNYLTDLSQHGETIEEIRAFIRQLFPEKDLRRYMWDHMASIVVGKNRNQTFNVYNGSGSNGKSKFVQQVALAMGDYYAVAPLALVTGKRPLMGGATPEVALLRGVRYAVMQEPSKGDVISEGPLKELTGGDPLTTRKLFKDTMTFVPQFHLAMCTNTLPTVKNFDDDATWRRMRVVEFKSRFVEAPVQDDPLAPYQFKIDKNIEDKFEKWKHVLLTLIVNRAFKTNGMVEDCRAVLDQAAIYRTIHDPFALFVREQIVSKKDLVVKEQDVYNTFKDWWELQDNGTKVPMKKDMVDYISKRYGKKVHTAGGYVWRGIGLIRAESDEYEPA
jgi:putative DNA primase/helicase